MRLDSLRIANCFGFVDSDEIDLSEPGNLTYFLGRNSSGKTSVLRAISYLEYGTIPSQHPNFANYEPTEDSSFIRGTYSVSSEKGKSLSARNIVDSVTKVFRGSHIQVRREDEKFVVAPSGSGAERNVVALLGYVYQVYSNLIERIQAVGEVQVGKLGNGAYQFYAKGDSFTDFKARRDAIRELINNVHSAFRSEGTNPPEQLNFVYIEGLLFTQFPDIFVFTDRFSLDENLPRSLREEHLRDTQNALTDTLIDILGHDKLAALLRANSMGKISSLREELQGRLDMLSARITEDAARGAADAGFLRLYVDRADDVRIVLRVDGKESYYEHLSDNTKFLVAYHVFQEDRRRKNELPSILLFDEPNSGFHPSAETKVLQFLESLAENSNQVLVTTHSQHMIDLDRLSAVRIMARSQDGTLRVSNKLYGTSGASQDTLALQPITEAIGLQYADQIVIRDKVVVVEGYTDMLYIRLFARLLGCDEPNLAPMTGESKMLTFIPFLISQGISFKVAFDSSEMKDRITESIPIPDDSFFVVEEHLGRKADRVVGIEDLFSKDDFKMLLDRCGHETNEKHLNGVSNSEYTKATEVKTIVAYEICQSNDLEGKDFSEETTENFKALLSFCETDRWFRA